MRRLVWRSVPLTGDQGHTRHTRHTRNTIAWRQVGIPAVASSMTCRTGRPAMVAASAMARLCCALKLDGTCSISLTRQSVSSRWWLRAISARALSVVNVAKKNAPPRRSPW